MASVFKVYGITGDAKEWFAQHYFGTVQREFDEAMLNSWTDVAAYTDKNLF